MSVALVQKAIANFLSRPDPEVLCVRGRWGIGKTYTWSKALEAAHKQGQIKLARYSYVSLFGLNSLAELKQAIFENVITFRNGLKKADLETLDAYVSSIGSWRKLTKVAQSVPIVRNWIGGEVGGLVSFMTIRDQIICIDDLERRGRDLDVGDVLGLISYLREQRNCKIALLLNDEELSEAGREDFDRNLEKVADASLVFEPTPVDSAKVGVPGDSSTDRLVAERCTSLGITNIRVIKRIRALVTALEPFFVEYDPEVFKTAVSSVVLFGWSHDQPTEAPSLKFLKGKTPDLILAAHGKIPPDEAAWNSLLEAYGYAWTDDFDQVLLDGVTQGYFDPDLVKTAAKAVNDKVLASKADGAFETAWSLYHDSFADNQEDVLNGIFASFKKTVNYISPTNLNGTITLFKDLGRLEQAKELLDYYMASRQEPRRFFDLDEYPFVENITDPDVRAAFEARAAETQETRDIAAILLSIKDTWNDEALTALGTAPIDEYMRVLKTRSGPELRRLLSNAFQFDRIVNATEQMKEIPRRTRAALKMIGQESAINARRVKRFGVDVDELAPAVPDAGRD